jgi:hypothetical protein
MAVLLQLFDPEGKPEDPFEFIFRELTAEKLGKLPNDILNVSGRPYVVIEVKAGEADDLFQAPVDTIYVKRKADQ